MNPRRVVEAFSDGGWTRREDGKEYSVDVKVNGVDKPFRLIVPVSGTLRVTIAGSLGHSPTDRELEEIAKVKIADAIPIGLLDDLPLASRVLIAIDYREVDGLVSRAKAKGAVTTGPNPDASETSY